MTAQNTLSEEDVLETLAVTTWDGPLDDTDEKRAVDALEAGRVLFFPSLAFDVEEDEKRFLTPEVLAVGSKNVSFDPASRTCQGSALQGTERDRLGAMLERFGRAAEGLVQRLAPGYAQGLIRARTSFRPAEIGTRVSSVRKNDRLLHVDAFPTRPTRGTRILRVFSNVAPDGAKREWKVGEPFPAFAEKFFSRVRMQGPGSAWLLEHLHLTHGRRTPYDSLMLALHDAVKKDQAYQSSAPHAELAFAPGTSWIVYTDQVLHAALSGRFALEQTFHLPIAAMARPERAPISILERIAGRRLA